MKYAFDCKCCGHCCEGRGGIVVSPDDLARLCAHLAVSETEFTARWGEIRGEKLHVRTGPDGSCIFFRSGTGCTVHPAKPDICRAWPYFRGNLVDAESLAMAKDFCPGIPPKMPHAAFVREGLAYLSEKNLIKSAATYEAGALQVSDLLPLLAENKKKR